jgi:DNA-binding transcriptional LysR family regulator
MQDMDWNLVRDFLAVARSGSLIKASASLGVNPSTVGRRVETLESLIGVTLFARAQTGYQLTDEGNELVERAERMEETALAFQRSASAKEAVRGKVRLATAENLANFIVIPALARLTTSHPELEIEVVTDIRSANLDRRDADIALRLVRPSQGNISIRKVGLQRYGLYGSVDYLARRKPSGAGRFDADEFITWTDSYADLPAAKWVTVTLQGRKPAMRTSGLFGQYAATVAGLGLAVLPCFVGDRNDQLRRLDCEADTIFQDLWLVMHSDLRASSRLRVMADFLVDLVRDNAAQLEGAHSHYASV